jgi:hypothetical protein
VKDESTSLPFAISHQKVESPAKKSMINQQVIGKSSAQKSKI